MGKKIIVSTIVCLIMMAFVIVLLHSVGFIHAKYDLILPFLSSFPGLQDLESNYLMGKKQTRELERKKKELLDLENRLKEWEQRLLLEQQLLESEKKKKSKDSIAANKNLETGTELANQQKISELEAKKRIDHLVSISQEMKPDALAQALLDISDETLVAQVLKKMDKKKAAKVLEKFPIEVRAKYITLLTKV